MENKGDIRNMLKDAGILFAITLIAGLLLGFVYELTKEPIRVQQEKAIQAACREVFTEAAAFEVKDYEMSAGLQDELAAMGVSIGTVFEARDADGTAVGYVVETASAGGYGGNITIYVGVTREGRLNGISILEIAETPGLGMKAEDELGPQFVNKQVSAFSYTKSGSKSDSEIDAISGATVTTKAVIDAVNGGLRVVNEELEKGGSGNE